jgi:hypothetical protein
VSLYPTRRMRGQEVEKPNGQLACSSTRANSIAVFVVNRRGSKTASSSIPGGIVERRMLSSVSE